jgi:Fe2+ or Zn2+ uptake regulation protein
VTPQRRAIIHALVENGSHTTADQVFSRVQDSMPDISPATVYNTLHDLADMGLLLELDLGLGERVYDVLTRDHSHLVCMTCGRVEDVPNVPCAPNPPPELDQGFQTVERRVIYLGYCPNCAPQEED